MSISEKKESEGAASAPGDQFVGFLNDVEGYLESEMTNVRLQKQHIEAEAAKLTKEGSLEEALKELEKFVVSSNTSLNTIKEDSEDIKGAVNKICELSERTLESFEVLKYRKSNVETILNRLTAIIELSKLLPVFRRAVSDKNLEECKRCIKSYKGIEECISSFTMPVETKEFMELTDKLTAELKVDFELAIEKNQNALMNQISSIFLMLHVEEHTLDKIMHVYSRKLDSEITTIVTHFLDLHKNANPENPPERAFFDTYLEYLRAVAGIIDSAKDAIYDQFKLDGLFHFIATLVNLRIEELFEKKFLNHFYTHYELRSIAVKKLHESSNQPHFLDLEAWINMEQNSVTKYQNTFNKLELMCEEVTDISYQTELFRKHIFNLLQDRIARLPDKTDKEKEDTRRSYARKIEGLKIFNYNMELLGSFNIYHPVFLRFQIVSILQRTDIICKLMSFDRGYFQTLLAESQELSSVPATFEYLDEIFFLMRSCGIRSLFTLNKSIACSFLNHLQSNVIIEDLYSVMTELLGRMMKKEFFNPSMIYFSSAPNIYNMIAVILLNNTERLMDYTRNLKDALMEEQIKFAEYYVEPKDSDLIVSCLEEMDGEVHKKFTHLLEDRMGFLADNLKLTIKNDVEKIKDINFQFSEGLMAEYEGKIQYSGGLKAKLNSCLSQWQKQFSKTNYERFILHLSLSVAKTIESIVIQKKFHQLGAILLDKEIRALISYFVGLAEINIKKNFSKLSYICEMLLLENQQEMTEFYNANAGDVTMEDFKRILRMRSDFL